MPDGIFIAGSGMDAGKTTLSLGMISWMEEHLPGGAAFMKPLGQKTTLVDGASVGEDSFLVNTSMGLRSSHEHAAPFAMSPGASRQYLETGEPRHIARTISSAYRHLASSADRVVVEGTGHPGVGSVFGLSNAAVARLLGIPVLLVLDAGIGATIDRFTLCSSLFHDRGVPLMGVVINRTDPSKLEKLRSYLDPWFTRRGVRVFGYIPYVSSIARPSVGMLGRKLGATTVIGGRVDADSPVQGFITGFGSGRDILQDVIDNPGSALLLSASRLDVIDAILSRRFSGSLETGPGALVLCGPETGHDAHVEEACRRLELPLYRTPSSVDQSVNRVSRFIFKVEPGESLKISEIVRTVRESVDMPAVMDALAGAALPEVRPAPMLVRAGRWVSRKLLGRSGG